MRRIGILMPYPPGDAEVQARVRAFREELRKRAGRRAAEISGNRRSFENRTKMSRRGERQYIGAPKT
jgi:hypothetical protein